jgi:hypothetical protein
LTPQRFFARDDISSSDDIDTGFEERGNSRGGKGVNFRPMTQIKPDEIFEQVRETNSSNALESMDL